MLNQITDCVNHKKSSVCRLKDFVRDSLEADLIPFDQADDDLLVVKSGEEGELCGDDPSSSCKGSGLKNDVEVSDDRSGNSP